MRKPLLVLAALLMIVAASSAQNAPTPKTNTPQCNDAKLDCYLEKWGTEDARRENAQRAGGPHRQGQGVEYDTKFVGYAQLPRSGDGPSVLNMAVLELKSTARTTVAEKMVCTGTYLYVFRPGAEGDPGV